VGAYLREAGTPEESFDSARRGFSSSPTVSATRAITTRVTEMTVGSSLRTQGVKEGLYELALPIGEEIRDIEAPEQARAS
jgi:hypothetical protein